MGHSSIKIDIENRKSIIWKTQFQKPLQQILKITTKRKLVDKNKEFHRQLVTNFLLLAISDHFRTLSKSQVNTIYFREIYRISLMKE